jgi:hypothetical protein
MTPSDRGFGRKALRFVGVVVCAAAVPGVGGATMMASLPPTTTEVVNAAAGDQDEPRIDGTLVVYTNSVGSKSEIRYHDLATGADAAIPRSDTVDRFPDVSGSTVVFSRDSAVVAYDTATLGHVDVGRGGPAAIGGRTIAFPTAYADTPESEIALRDLDTQTTTRLTMDTLLDSQVAASAHGSAVAWIKCASDGFGGYVDCDAWGATRSANWAPTRLTTDGAVVSSLDVDDSLVAYVRSEGDIAWRSVSGGAETRLSRTGFQSDPKTSRGVILFRDYPTGDAPADLYLYDVAGDTIYQVTSTPANEEAADISVSSAGLVRIAYEVNEEGDRNLYAKTFQLPVRSAPEQLAALIALVEGFDLKQGIETSLDAKLANAKHALERASVGDTATACGLLDAFLSEVAAQSGKALTLDQASQLTEKAQAVKAALGCA